MVFVVREGRAAGTDWKERVKRVWLLGVVVSRITDIPSTTVLTLRILVYAFARGWSQLVQYG